MAINKLTGHGPNFKDLTGRVNGRLTVIRFVGLNRWGASVWHCRCECGVEKQVSGNSLTATKKHKRTLSCGCYNREFRSQLSTKHGMSHSLTYSSWGAMIKRCTDPGDPAYMQYGGAGIEVCDRWRGEHGFENFHADNGTRPSAEHSIDRFPNKNGNYEPGNTRWATDEQQAWNRSSTKMLTFNGETMPFSVWARRIGISPTTLNHRLKRGWPLEEALTAPAKVVRHSIKTFTHDGVTLSLPAWAERVGMSYQTLYCRIKMGWAFADAVAVTPFTGNRVGPKATNESAKGWSELPMFDE